MKGYHKDKGWLIKCEGGPLASNYVRGYNIYRGEEKPLDWEFRVVGHDARHSGHEEYAGRYILKPLMKADGQTRKKAKHKGVDHDAFYYEWVPDPQGDT